MKLKTLKDLSVEVGNDWAGVDELKAEAVKWVRDINNDLKKFEHLQNTNVTIEIDRKVQGLIATEQWIINFFNITEEDLK